MENLLIIADDLTGTVDTGAFPVIYGKHVTAYLDYQAYMKDERQEEVTAVNMGTRALLPEEAVDRHLKCAPAIDKAGGVILKKIDMGLRGNPACEIDTLLHNTKRNICFLMPAIPEFMTFTLYGYEFVKGCVLEKSLYASDPLHTITSSYIPEILEKASGIRCGAVNIDTVKGDDLEQQVADLIAQGKNVIVFDAVSDGDCSRIVSTLLPKYPDAMWAGTLGLISAVCKYLYGTDTKREGHEETVGRTIGFMGSNYTVSKKQIRYAVQNANLKTVDFNIGGYVTNPEKEIEILKLHCEEFEDTADIMVVPLVAEAYAVPDLIQKALVDAAEAVLQVEKPGRIVIIGGETAYNIFRQLKITKLKITDKPESGIASGIILDGMLAGRLFALKGGSVGSIEAVKHMLGK